MLFLRDVIDIETGRRKEQAQRQQHTHGADSMLIMDSARKC